MQYYPVYLDLRDRPCAVVGGSGPAEEKVRGLLAAGALVTVIAERLAPGLEELVRERAVTAVGRRLQLGDLEGICLAIVTDEDPAVRELACLEALRRGILVNTVDDVPRCNFIAPSIVRRGDLAVAISTGGKAPALAVRLRQRLEAELGEEHARFLELAGQIRPALAARHPEFGRRRELWYRLVDSDVLELLKRGDEEAARERFAEILGVAPVTPAGAVAGRPA